MIKNFISKICDNLPKNISNILIDLEKKFFYIFQSQINCMNLITKEDFENQQKFLIYISKKIDEIENRIEEIEKFVKYDSAKKK